MSQTTLKSKRSIANEFLNGPSFGDGNWYRLVELENFEARLLQARQQDRAFSDAVRIDRSSEEKLRRDELIPFMYLAKHRELSPKTRFRKPGEDRGVDIEFELDGIARLLQVSTAYPTWTDEAGNAPSGGYQHRLHMEKLTDKGYVSGSGPYERRDGEIWNHEGCNSWEDIEAACRSGLVHAFQVKRLRGSNNVTLLIRAVGYYQEIVDAARFIKIADGVAALALPNKFSSVIVVDNGPGFFWSSSNAQLPNCR